MKSNFLNGESLSALAVAVVIISAFLMMVEQVGLPDIFIPSLATLAAAFTGAWAAFTLHSKREESEKHKRNIENANKALFVFYQMINELTVIQAQVIDPVRDDPIRFLSMSSYIVPDYSNLTFAFDGLSFIFKATDPNILAKLMIEQNNFHQAISTLDERSNFHLHSIQPQLDHSGFIEGEPYTMDNINEMLGLRFFRHITKSTE